MQQQQLRAVSSALDGSLLPRMHLPQRRVALLLCGTKDSADLPGAKADIELMRRTLSLDLPVADRFFIVEFLDLGNADVALAAVDLYAMILAATPASHQAIGVLYFAGHGVVRNGRQCIEIAGVSLELESEVLTPLKQHAPLALQFVILDCCRSKDAAESLNIASIQNSLSPRTGTMAPLMSIIHACSAGQTASDIGYFAQAFRARLISERAAGRPWTEVMRLVDVSLAPLNQRPQITGPAAFNDFCFVRAVSAPAAQPAPRPLPHAVTPTVLAKPSAAQQPSGKRPKGSAE